MVFRVSCAYCGGTGLCQFVPADKLAKISDHALYATGYVETEKRYLYAFSEAGLHIFGPVMEIEDVKK